MRWVLMVVLALVAAPGRAQDIELTNSACEAACKGKLDRCAAVSNRIMHTALKETSAYTVDAPERQRADVKFEAAFQAGEKCWDGYFRCAATCRPAKACLDACRSTFKRCFAQGEKKMREGLKEMRSSPFGSPAWQAANAKGDAELDQCLVENHNCQTKCANP